MLSSENSRKISMMGFASAIMVVFIHIPKADANAVAMYIERFVGCGICYMAVPFFFLVAGFMLARHSQEHGWWRTAVRKRFRSLIVPYLVWCLVAYLVHALVSFPMVVVANHLHHEPLLRNLGMVFPSLILALGLNPLQAPNCVPLWFLRMLILLVMASPLLVALVRRKTIAMACLSLMFAAQLVVGATVSEACPWHDFFYYFLSFQGVFYFSVGIYLARHGLPQVSWKFGWIVLAVAMILVGLKTGGYMGDIAVGPWLASILNETAIVLLLIGCWTVVPQRSFSIAKYSFPIYVLHPIVINMFAPVEILFPNMKQSLAYYFVFGILVIVLSIMIAKFLKSRFCSFAGIAFGGR